MKTDPSLMGTVALAAAWLILGWTGCRSTPAEKPAPYPALKPVASPPPPPAREAAPTTPAPPVTSPVATVAAAPSPANVPQAVPADALPPAPPPADNPPLARVAPQPPAHLSPGVQAVVDMVHAQVSVPVLLEYVNATTNIFQLESADIVYLKDLGIPDEVITAMLKRAGREPVATSGSEPAAAPGPTPETAPPPSASDTPALAGPTPQSTYDQTVTPTLPAPQATPTPAPSAPPPGAPPVTENYFYSALAPYGSWLYIEPYGWCWQPTVAVVDRTWRPYLHGGRWVYTSAGWYWQSYYTWGWAPFHYGNWYLSPVWGWVWVPGHVWAPAWVVWRYSDTYCGWAPLPPGTGWHPVFGLTYWGSRVSVGFGFNLGWSSFVFCTWDDWWRPFPYRYCLPPHRVAVVYHQTTIINNFYLDKSRNTIINEGVPLQAMPTRVRQELRKVELADIPADRTPSLVPERTLTPEGKLAVYRPQVPPDLKLASAKPTDAPYRPVRTRTESGGPGRTLLVPERSPEALSGLPPRTGVAAAPAPQRDLGLDRGGVPVRAPQRHLIPERRETPAPALNPAGRTPVPARAPEATRPQRSVPSPVSPGAVQPSVPNRPDRLAPGTISPPRPERSGVSPVPQTGEPRTPSTPNITPPLRAPATSAPPPRRTPESGPVLGRSERPTLTAPPAIPRPAPNPDLPRPKPFPETRLHPGAVAPPNRSLSVVPAPGMNPPRIAPPTRREGAPPLGLAPAPGYAPPPARAVVPSVPSPAPSRAPVPSAPPGFNPPASRPNFNRPPAVAGPPARLENGPSTPARSEARPRGSGSGSRIYHED